MALNDVSLLTLNIVYPETKGVPLEEMDAVFGEGKLPQSPLVVPY
jgi:hypothetical protein